MAAASNCRMLSLTSFRTEAHSSKNPGIISISDILSAVHIPRTAAAAYSQTERLLSMNRTMQ